MLTIPFYLMIFLKALKDSSIRCIRNKKHFTRKEPKWPSRLVRITPLGFDSGR